MMASADVSTAADKLPPELVARFRAAHARLKPEGRRIGLAVSGGPDSMAMLLLAHAAIPGEFEVSTVDHGLRAEAKDECALVLAACKVRGIACEVLSVKVGDGNVQQQARIARYRALGAWGKRRGLAALATAHHIDDQAETLLMRLNRGSGVAGLAGVRERQLPHDLTLPLIRPMLGFRRSELGQIIQATNLCVANDPSNQDERFDRVRMRNALAGCDWLDPAAIAQSASNLADAFEALQDYANLLWPQKVSIAGEEYRLTPDAPREINRRLVARIMECLGGKPRGGDVARLLLRMENGETGNVAGVLGTVVAGTWVFRPEPPRSTA